MTDRIYQAMVGNDVDGQLFLVDVISHDGKLWLVPSWLEVPSLGVSRPARIIRFDNRPHQHFAGGSLAGDFVLNVPVPKALLETAKPLKQQAFSFDYVELPDIDIPVSVRPLRGSHLH